MFAIICTSLPDISRRHLCDSTYIVILFTNVKDMINLPNNIIDHVNGEECFIGFHKLGVCHSKGMHAKRDEGK